jgi:hypothetical protein
MPARWFIQGASAVLGAAIAQKAVLIVLLMTISGRTFAVPSPDLSAPEGL